VSLQEVWQLLQEFQALISSYVMKYQPPDAAEWRSVIQEVRSSWTLQYSMVQYSSGAVQYASWELAVGATQLLVCDSAWHTSTAERQANAGLF
jgi:hypothetical protein